jgi:hypothetical protein
VEFLKKTLAVAKRRGISHNTLMKAAAVWYSTDSQGVEKVTGLHATAVDALAKTNDPAFARCGYESRGTSTGKAIWRHTYAAPGGGVLTPQEVHRRRMRGLQLFDAAANAEAATAELAVVGDGVWFVPLTQRQYLAVEQLVNDYVDRCRVVARKEFGVEVNPIVRIDTTKRRRRSRASTHMERRFMTERRQLRAKHGRESGISISVQGRISLKGDDLFAPAMYAEYKTLSPFGDIGSIDTACPLAMVVVHEMAHATDFAVRGSLRRAAGGRAHHGVDFCRVYSVLRRKLGLVARGMPLFWKLDPAAQAAAVGIDGRPKRGRPSQPRPKGTEHLSKEQYARELNRRRQARFRAAKKAAE